jgi:microcompartment protein CcmK/EutM
VRCGAPTGRTVWDGCCPARSSASSGRPSPPCSLGGDHAELARSFPRVRQAWRRRSHMIVHRSARAGGEQRRRAAGGRRMERREEEPWRSRMKKSLQLEYFLVVLFLTDRSCRMGLYIAVDWVGSGLESLDFVLGVSGSSIVPYVRAWRRERVNCCLVGSV